MKCFLSKTVTLPTIESMATGTITIQNWEYIRIPQFIQFLDFTYGNVVLVSNVSLSGTTLTITIFNPTSKAHGTHDITMLYSVKE